MSAFYRLHTITGHLKYISSIKNFKMSSCATNRQQPWCSGYLNCTISLDKYQRLQWWESLPQKQFIQLIPAKKQCTSKTILYSILKWDKVFKNGPCKICGRQPLKTWRDMVYLRLSSASFTWSNLENFVSNMVYNLPRIMTVHSV